MSNLNNMEIKLIQLMAEGLTNRQMADHFYRASEKTIGKQRSRLFKKLGVGNSPQCIAFAFRNHILS